MAANPNHAAGGSVAQSRRTCNWAAIWIEMLSLFESSLLLINVMIGIMSFVAV